MRQTAQTNDSFSPELLAYCRGELDGERLRAVESWLMADGELLQAAQTLRQWHREGQLDGHLKKLDQAFAEKLDVYLAKGLPANLNLKLPERNALPTGEPNDATLEAYAVRTLDSLERLALESRMMADSLVYEQAAAIRLAKEAKASQRPTMKAVKGGHSTQTKTARRTPLWRYAAAVAALLVIGFGIGRYVSESGQKIAEGPIAQQTDWRQAGGAAADTFAIVEQAETAIGEFKTGILRQLFAFSRSKGGWRKSLDEMERRHFLDDELDSRIQLYWKDGNKVEWGGEPMRQTPELHSARFVYIEGQKAGVFTMDVYEMVRFEKDTLISGNVPDGVRLLKAVLKRPEAEPVPEI